MKGLERVITKKKTKWTREMKFAMQINVCNLACNLTHVRIIAFDLLLLAFSICSSFVNDVFFSAHPHITSFPQALAQLWRALKYQALQIVFQPLSSCTIWPKRATPSLTAANHSASLLDPPLPLFQIPYSLRRPKKSVAARGSFEKAKKTYKAEDRNVR